MPLLAGPARLIPADKPPFLDVFGIQHVVQGGAILRQRGPAFSGGLRRRRREAHRTAWVRYSTRAHKKIQTR